MSLFKYFEKRTTDGLPDPNGLLSARLPLDEISAKSAASEGKKLGP